MPDAPGHRVGCIGLRHGQDVVPAMEAHHDLQGEGIECVEHIHLFHVRPHELLRALGIVYGSRIVAHERVFHRDEVQIMGVVHQWIDALRMSLCEIGFIGAHGGEVGFLTIFVIPYANVDVRGHVDQVSRRWCEARQALGRGQAGFRMRRRLDGVDVEVVRTEMIGIAFQYSLEHGNDLFGSGVRFAVMCVELPRMHVHAALGEESCGVEVVGIALVDLAHRVVIGGLEAIVVRIRLVCVPSGERLDVIALVWRAPRGKGQRLLHCFVRTLFPVAVDGQIVIRAKHQSDAPVGHGHFRIEFGGPAEALLRLIMVEAVVERQSLLEQTLRFRIRGLYPMMKLAEALRGTCEGHSCGGTLLLSGRETHAQRDHQQRSKPCNREWH